MNKKVSIIIPVYNQEVLVKRALDSIPNRDDIEVICIDDCSTDSTYDVLSSYTRIPLRVFKTDINSGPGAARNIGYDNATGEYVYGLDSDDSINTKEFSKLLDKWPGNYDIIHTPIKVNNGSYWNTNGDCCAPHTYLVKRNFLGESRMPHLYYGEDLELLKELVNKHPKKLILKSSIYNYNYPREGSLDWNHNKGK